MARWIRKPLPHHAMTPPPPLPKRQRMPKHVKLLCLVGVIGGLGSFAIVALRASGFVRPFVVPTSAMAPALEKNDRIFAGRLSLMHREAKRGEIVIFSTAHITEIMANAQGRVDEYFKRLVGLPGEQLRIDHERLLVNGVVPPELKDYRCTLVDSFGKGPNLEAGCIVPPDSVFVVGDNTDHSYDSRFWGFVPKADLTMVYLCHYWRSPTSQK